MPRDLAAERESSPAAGDMDEAQMPELQPAAQLDQEQTSYLDDDEWESETDEIEDIGHGNAASFFPGGAGGGMSSLVARLLEEDFAAGREGPPNDMPQALKELHPYATTLGLNDVESCVALENASFPENMRATRDKFRYRLSRCGECCFGFFTSADTTPPDTTDTRSYQSANAPEVLSAPTLSAANPPDSSSPARKGVLLAHIIATKSTNPTVHDSDMALPDDWQTNKSTTSASEPVKGHQEHGRVLQIHSLAVLPTYQGRGLGSTLLRAYVQRMASADVADKLVLLAEDKLVPFYVNLGFENKGKSKHATFGGEAWNDLIMDLRKIREEEEDEEEDEDEEMVEEIVEE